MAEDGYSVTGLYYPVKQEGEHIKAVHVPKRIFFPLEFYKRFAGGKGSSLPQKLIEGKDFFNHIMKYTIVNKAVETKKCSPLLRL
jgi:hypothetical protein